MAIKHRGLLTLSTLALHLSFFFATSTLQAQNELVTLQSSKCSGEKMFLDITLDEKKEVFCSDFENGIVRVYDGAALANGTTVMIRDHQGSLNTLPNIPGYHSSQLATFSGQDNFGLSIAKLGDLDSDGTLDYAILSRSIRHGNNGLGGPFGYYFRSVAYIYSGRTGNEITSYLLPVSSFSHLHTGFDTQKIHYLGVHPTSQNRHRLGFFRTAHNIANKFAGGITIMEFNPQTSSLEVVGNPTHAGFSVFHAYNSVSFFGFQMKVIPDQPESGDGMPDYLISAPYWATSHNGILRKVDSVTLQTIGAAIAGAPSSFLGLTLEEIGDVNNDGVNEFAAAAPSAFNINQPGQIQIIDGRFASPIGAPITVPGTNRLGLAMAALDVNGDNSKDLAVLSSTTLYLIDVFNFSPTNPATVIHQEPYTGPMTTGYLDASPYNSPPKGTISGAGKGYHQHQLYEAYLNNLAIQPGDNYGCNSNLVALSGTTSAGNGGLIPSLHLEGCARQGADIAIKISEIDHNYATTILHSVSELASYPIQIGTDVFVYPARSASHTQTVSDNLLGPISSIILRNIQTEETGDSGFGSIFMQAIRFGQSNPNTSNPNSSIATSLPYELTIEMGQ